MLGKCILVLAIVVAVTMTASVEGRRVLPRPISVSHLRRMLKVPDREEAVSEGRVVPGFSLFNGLALGLKKGVLGVAIADSLASWANRNNSTNSIIPSVSYNGTTHELCFTSRSATSDIVASGEARENDDSTAGTTTGAATSDMGTIDDSEDDAPTQATATNSATNSGTGTVSATNSASTTRTSAPTTNCIVINKG